MNSAGEAKGEAGRDSSLRYTFVLGSGAFINKW